MANVSEAILEDVIAHRVGIERLSVDVVRRILVLLGKVEPDIEAQIRRRLEGIEAGLLEASDGTFQRLERLLSRIRAINAEAHLALRAKLKGELIDLSRFEVEFAERLYRKHLGLDLLFDLPSAGLLRSIVTSQPFRGRLLREWGRGLEAQSFRRVKDAIQIGMTEGEGIDQIVRRIRGTRKLRYRDGVVEITRQDARRIVRTAVNHVSNRAHEAFIHENPEMFRGMRWVSVLDHRTSPICQARAGRIYPINSGPRPPAHFNCRSTVTPVVRGSPIREEPTYQNWLERQPAKVQDDILGPTRGRLFRRGGLAVDRFVDRRGNALTLEQLRERETEAFARAVL